MTPSAVRVVGLPAGRLDSAREVRQVPFAMALALTRTAMAGREAGKLHIRRNLRQAKPFTLNGVRFERATKQRLHAEVRVRDEASKGTPPAKYLRALEFGGHRRYKRFERALQYAGVLEPNEFAIPADGGSIDLRGKGNVGGLYTRILSGLRANPDPLSNTPSLERGRRGVARARSRARYFRRGEFIWERLNRSTVRPVLVIIKRAPSYRKTLRFAETVAATTRHEMPRQWQDAMRQAKATARR